MNLHTIQTGWGIIVVRYSKRFAEILFATSLSDDLAFSFLYTVRTVKDSFMSE